MQNYTQFENLLSFQRMNRYLIACYQDKQKALVLYKLNSQLSQTMFGVVALFEIALRNKINNHYKFVNSNWLVNGFLHSNNCTNSIKDIEETRPELQRDGKSFTNDNILTKLTLNFWKMLFAPQQFRAGGNSLLEIFVNIPPNVSQNNIYNKIDKIRKLRNRIAHHEPICFHYRRISTRNTKIVYENIIELITWFGINPQELFEGIDEIPLYLHKINTL
jgi:hypothetical protein